MSEVNKQSSAVEEMAPDWALVRALLGGTKSMRTAGKAYLPQWPNEEEKAYDFRLKTSVLFPAFKRTIETLAAKPFSKPITIGEDVPEELKKWLDDIDLQGRNIDAFAADLMECALGYGLSGILVDFPDATGVPRNPSGIVTKAAEKNAGLRPYCIQIFSFQILGWKAKYINGAWQLLQLRIMEEVEEDDGPFGTKTVPQVRVLEPGKWEIYRKDPKDEKKWILHANGLTTISFVPFVPVYGQRTGFMKGKPPLIELAQMNVKHWQSQSDQDTILHVARVPILTIIGVDDEKFTLEVGASSAIKLPIDADMKYVEHTGAAIEAGKISLDDLKEEMRQAGAELLVIKSGEITAAQNNTENAVGMCALQRMVQHLEDALDQALQFMAIWSKKKEGGHVTLFNDFGAASLAEASADLLQKMNFYGTLSDETLFAEMQRRGLLRPELTWEEEKARIAAQPPKEEKTATGKAETKP